MKAHTLFFLLLISFQVSSAQNISDSLLNQLDSVIARRDFYTKEKMDRISLLKKDLAGTQGNGRFELLREIYEEYKSFVYDSAAVYALKLREHASQLNDPVKIADSKIKSAFILTSSGLLNEALDSLMAIRVEKMPDQVKVDYYYLLVRTCYDLADFVQNKQYEVQYEEMAKSYVDSALTLLSPNAVDYLIISGLRDLHLEKIAEAKIAYEKLINQHQLSGQQFAIAASTLSYIYFLEGNPHRSNEMLVKAVISDIKSSTKETFAIVKLADLLYREGNIEKAYQYIRLAMDDANFYGARYRKQQLAGLFPLIEGERRSQEETKRNMLLIYSILITGSVIVFVAVLYIIKRKNNKLEKAQQIISRANNKLEESNKIKEEYLWYFFNIIAEYIGKLDAFKTTINNKLLAKKIDDLKAAAEHLDIKQERNKLFHNFDIVFLKLFPDFVDVFNSLLAEENRIVLKDGQLLSVEMRIFALIRLGIHDHEKIAKILGYSLTTIYTYKTRIKAKAIVNSEEFDHRIESIPAL